MRDNSGTEKQSEKNVKSTLDGYLITVGGISEPAFKTQDLVQEAARISTSLGVDPKHIVLTIQKCVDDEVKEILDSPRPLDFIGEILDVIIVGEDSNNKAIFVLLLSVKSDDPKKREMILFKSSAGGGKSTIANALTKPYKTKKIGRMSERALDHSDLANVEILRACAQTLKSDRKRKNSGTSYMTISGKDGFSYPPRRRKTNVYSSI